MKYIGIDIGFSGAIAVIEDRHVLAVHDMPVMWLPCSTTGKSRKHLDVGVTSSLLRQYADSCVVAIEKVNPFPGEGVSSSFRFGQQFGTLQGICSGLKLNTVEVSPVVWKRNLGLLKAKKADSIALALKLFPECSLLLARKKDHGRAEAILICEWLRKNNNNSEK